ncbi:MAG: hypothetical protein ACUVTF_09925 [bacterium]
MNRLRVLVLFLIAFNLIFAEEIKSDSLHCNINLMKRQKLFFASEENWIPPSLPDDETCLGVGCCLFSITGFVVIYRVNKDYTLTQSQPDTTEIQGKKWNIGFNYNLSTCYTGRDLIRYSELWPTPLDVLYWLNCFECNCSYRFRPRWAIDGGIGYGWAQLENRKGGDWKVNRISIFIKKREYFPSLVWSYGIELNYATAISYTDIIEKCLGGGLIFSVEPKETNIKKRIDVVPFLVIRIAAAYNQFPPAENTGFEINFSGIGGGLKIRIGG